MSQPSFEQMIRSASWQFPEEGRDEKLARCSSNFTTLELVKAAAVMLRDHNVR
jgi:hypothetical protein